MRANQVSALLVGVVVASVGMFAPLDTYANATTTTNNNGKVTFDIEDKTIDVSELSKYTTYESDGEEYYIVPVAINYTNDTDIDIFALSLCYDTDLSVLGKVANGEFAKLTSGDAFYEYGWEGATEQKRLIYLDEYYSSNEELHYQETDGVAVYINLFVPVDQAVDGNKFPIAFSTSEDRQNKVYDLNANGSQVDNDTYVDFLGGYIQFVDNSNIAYGDVNGDSLVNSSDAVALKKHVIGVETLDETYIANADCYTDGKIDARDLFMLLSYIIKTSDAVQKDGNPDEVAIENSNVRFEIEQLTIEVSNLNNYDMDNDGNFIIPVAIDYYPNENLDIKALQFKLDTNGLEIQARGTSGVIAKCIEGYAFAEDMWDASTGEKIITYEDIRENICETYGTACYINVLVPSYLAVDGSQFLISFDSTYDNLVYDSDMQPIIPNLEDGYINIFADDVDYDDDDDYNDDNDDNNGDDNVCIEESVYATLDANGGECSNTYISGYYYPGLGQVVLDKCPIPVRKGYFFDGWYDALEGGNLAIDESGTASQNYYWPKVSKLYAHWTKIDPYADCVFDVNQDGQVNIIDLILLKKKILGII